MHWETCPREVLCTLRVLWDEIWTFPKDLPPHPPWLQVQALSHTLSGFVLAPALSGNLISSAHQVNSFTSLDTQLREPQCQKCLDAPLLCSMDPLSSFAVVPITRYGRVSFYFSLVSPIHVQHSKGWDDEFTFISLTLTEYNFHNTRCSMKLNGLMLIKFYK